MRVPRIDGGASNLTALLPPPLLRDSWCVQAGCMHYTICIRRRVSLAAARSAVIIIPPANEALLLPFSSQRS